MKFCYFGGQNSFLSSVFGACNTQKVGNLKSRTISVTLDKQKLKKGRSKGVTRNWWYFCFVPFLSSLSCVFAFAACQKSSYPSGLQLLACCMLEKLKKGRNFDLQNSKISYEILNWCDKLSVLSLFIVFASLMGCVSTNAISVRKSGTQISNKKL